MRSPVLHDTLRRFCLGAFAVFVGELDNGGSLPAAFEEHRSPGKPSLYEYRPLVRGFVEARADRLYERLDVADAVADLEREPAARIFAAAYDARANPRHAIYRSVLVPLLVKVAEGCGGFDWDDSVFELAYEDLEATIFGDGHSYGAVAPLVGLSVGTPIELGDGIRVRQAAQGELSAMWPEATGLLPRDFGREVDRMAVLELERTLPAGSLEGPDAPGELADAVTAIRLATAAPVAAGPVLFERLDWRPFGIRPVLPIAATPPPGEPTRLDPFRASVAADLRVRLVIADDDLRLGEALDRWELALFQTDPFRAEQLRHALDGALGEGQGTWAAVMRGAALLGETAGERATLAERLREPSCEIVRQLLVAVLLHEDRSALVRELDDRLLGLPARAANLQRRAS
ncbi:MAG: hypothetical protein QOG85_1017 [Gaiellaceae bacterium]|jgi:hypothetical protein|nr:hypothetical protein [Gaiellaceae bacterium]